MTIEDALGIQIEDSEAEELLTPRQFIDSVTRKVASTRSGICLIGYERLSHRVSEGTTMVGELARWIMSHKAELAEVTTKILLMFVVLGTLVPIENHAI